MIRFFKHCEPSPTVIEAVDPDWTLPEGAVWLDLISPTRAKPG